MYTALCLLENVFGVLVFFFVWLLSFAHRQNHQVSFRLPKSCFIFTFPNLLTTFSVIVRRVFRKLLPMYLFLFIFTYLQTRKTHFKSFTSRPLHLAESYCILVEVSQSKARIIEKHEAPSINSDSIAQTQLVVAVVLNHSLIGSHDIRLPNGAPETLHCAVTV